MQKTTRHSAGASLLLGRDGVLCVRFFGPLTAATLHHVKAEIVAGFAVDEIAAFLVNYRACAVVMTGAELDSLLEGESIGSVPSKPAAMIVSPEVLPLFTGHCVRMAQHGIVRQAFTDEARAAAWAARHALRVKTKT